MTALRKAFFLMAMCLLAAAPGLAQESSAPALLVSGGVIDTAKTNGPQTYTGHTFYFTGEQMNQILETRNTACALGENIWRENQLFSSSEDHGEPVYYYHRADGFFLKDLLRALKVGQEEILALDKVELIASDQYITAFDHFSSLPRYYFSSQSAEGEPAEAMLAFYAANQSRTAEGIGNQEKKPVPGVWEPTFMFGQADAEDRNNCNYAKYVQIVELGGTNPLQVRVLGGKKDLTYYFTTAQLMAMGMEDKQYAVNGGNYLVQGLDLKAFLTNLPISGSYAVGFASMINGVERESSKRLVLDELEYGRYTLCWYSAEGGRMVANETEHRLYGDNLSMANLSAVILSPLEDKP